MGKRLRSLKWRTLSRKGFTIERAPGQPTERRWSSTWITDGLRHPMLLVLFGFLCTGVVGKYLSDRQDEQQRQREAVVKSMDDLRASMDDLSVAYAEYDQRAMVFISVRESVMLGPDLTSARKAYNEAYIKLQERLTVDGPNIEQRYPSAPNDYSIPALLTYMKVGLGFADACITNGAVKPLAMPDKGRIQQLMCDDTKKTTITASNRLMANYVCNALFTSKLRPDPKDDFADHQSSQGILSMTAKELTKQCDVRKLIGTVDLGGNDVN